MNFKFEGIPTNALLDTGASCSLIDIGTLRNLSLDNKIMKSQHEIVNASGNKMNISGSVNIEVSLQNKVISQNFKVLHAESYQNVLLGRDFLSKFGNVELDFTNKRVRLGTGWHKFLKVKDICPVTLINEVTIPGRSENIIEVHCPKSSSLVTADFEPLTRFTTGIYATHCRVIPNTEGIFHILLLNVNTESISLKNNTTIGHLVHPDEVYRVSSEVNSSESLSIDFFKDVAYAKTLDSMQRNQIASLLSKYRGVFASNPKKPTLVKGMEHRIITSHAQPVKRKPYRLPHAWHEEVNEQVSEMLKNDIIRPSSSPWNAPVILVKKKDGSIRFVCDYRGLNDVTKKDSYPLPLIRDVLDNMHGAKFWTTLDAAAAYWSMPLAEQDKEKTAFAVPRGKYEFNVTPFGLCNAGASYQRLIDMSLSGLPSDRTLAYMDDIVVFSKSFEDHLYSLEQIFQRLSSSGISLKLSKCVFACEKVDFLGFELSKSGIKPQSRLTTAINQFQRPTTQKELKGFLGLSGFYRAFIPAFATISKPLTAMTSHKVPFTWTDECEKSFQELKHALSSEPVLAFPNTNKPFIVDVDASNLAVGGVLSQIDDNGDSHPIAFFSTALVQSQKNWAATTKEAYALIAAIRHWHVYLAGSKFVINSDHNPLTRLRNTHDPRGKISRWISELEEYEYTIQYVRGSDNVRADALSRNRAASNTHPPSDFEDKIYSLFTDNTNFPSQLQEEQSRDIPIRDAMEAVNDNGNISTGKLKRVQKQLRVENGVLTKSGRPVVPASLRKVIVSTFHHVAHLGTDKIYALLQDRFYWPSMYKYIRTFIQTCTTCQRTKSNTLPPKAPLLPMFIPNAPMQLVSIDIAYLPRDAQGFQYMLLIGDVFSKFIVTVPLKTQTAPDIVNALLTNWIYIHGTPSYLLSDQGSNVDGQTMRNICNELGIEKRRSSAYHSQGNGFAERNIRSVKDMLRALLLHQKLGQEKWRKVLQSLVFALNSSFSKAIKCVPFNVVFGRTAVLPQDIIFQSSLQDHNDPISANEHERSVSKLLQTTFEHVIDALKLNQKTMQSHYNRKLRVVDYRVGQNVWLQTKHYKTGENRKLAPRRNGPWKITAKLPNAVNFEIANARGEKKIVHHNRMSPVTERTDNHADGSSVEEDVYPSERAPVENSAESSTSSSEEETYSSDHSFSDDDQDREVEEAGDNHIRRAYPLRVRRQRRISDCLPWDAIQL